MQTRGDCAQPEELIYRQADEADAEQLARMRWDFRTEGPHSPGVTKEDFVAAYAKFFRAGLGSGKWAAWIAEGDGTILSHAFVQRIEMVPKPARLDDCFGYLTNVYTRPAHRTKGIGSELLRRLREWARGEGFELLIVWPSEQSTVFYERIGFRPAEDIMECVLLPCIE